MAVKLGFQIETLNSPWPTPALYNGFGTHATVHWTTPFPAVPGQFWIDGILSGIGTLRSLDSTLDVRLHVFPPKSGAYYYLPSDLNVWHYWLNQLALQCNVPPYPVNQFSIGNEFNSGAWVGTPGNTWAQSIADFQVLLQYAYDALHQGNPAAVVLDDEIAGSIYGVLVAQWLVDQGLSAEALSYIQAAWYQNPPLGRGAIPQTQGDLTTLLASAWAGEMQAWFDAHFSNTGTGFADFYDEYGLHYYQGWETLQRVFDFLADTMTVTGFARPIQYWELGYAWAGDLGAWDYEVQANSALKSAVLALANGVLHAIHFPLFGLGTIFKGLAYESGGSQLLTPAGTMWGTLAAQLNGKDYLGPVTAGTGVTAHQFSGGVGVMWSTGGCAIADLSTVDPAPVWKITRKDGTFFSARPRVRISSAPVFFEVNP